MPSSADNYIVRLNHTNMDKPFSEIYNKDSKTDKNTAEQHKAGCAKERMYYRGGLV